MVVRRAIWSFDDWKLSESFSNESEPADGRVLMTRARIVSLQVPPLPGEKPEAVAGAGGRIVRPLRPPAPCGENFL